MENQEIEKTVRKITKLILTNPQKLVREEDLKTLSSNQDFEEIISEVYQNLQNVGFELIKTKFFDQNFYVLTTDGMDDTISPSQYGILALITALGKELEENLPKKDLMTLFSDVWDSDIKFLIDNDYLREIEDLDIIRVTPLGKAILKNIIQDLRLKNLLNVFEQEKPS
jgi:predicted transcriptional regulator